MLKCRINPAEMPDDAENQVLGSCARCAGEGARQVVEQGIDAFAAVEPSCHQPGGCKPRVGCGTAGRRRGSGAHAPLRPTRGELVPAILTLGLTRLDIVRSTL